MAGRVEQRINDRFYFVLDEVGGSSGIESESESVELLPTEDQSRDISKKQTNNDIDLNNTNFNDKGMEKANEHNVDNCNLDNSGSKITDFSVDSVDISCQNNDSSDKNANITLSETGIHTSKSLDSSCPDSVPIDMDIDNDSEKEIEPKYENEAVAPIIKISFRDEKIEESYKSSLLKFLAQKIYPCTVVTNSENNLELEIYKELAEKVLDDDVLDFRLDTTPDYDSRTSKIPSYGKNHGIVLSDSSSQPTTTVKNESPSPVCFNCCGNHVLRNCPFDRDPARIGRNRLKCQSGQKSSKNRYHLDENQRFGSFVPGELSKKLRNALDLRKDQQPLFIYRMRLLGYPPAWLEEARVSHSGMAIYDRNGVPISEDDEEEGEIISDGAKDRFDISKIIEFPGFNVPLPKTMKEEGKLHFCPPMSEEQSKENMIKKLKPNAVQAYKKKSLTLQKYSSQDESPTVKDMDRKRCSSPTIEEMEEKKRQLLMALDNEDANSDSKSNQEDVSVCGQDVTESEVKSETPDIDRRHVKIMSFGTPVLKSISPYSKLPSRESFSVNMSDVINFENLPNSTGKYESMSNLILKIRDTVSRIQNE